MAAKQINYTFTNKLGIVILASCYTNGDNLLLQFIKKTRDGVEDKSIFFPFDSRIGNIVAPSEFVTFSEDNQYVLNTADFANGAGSSTEVTEEALTEITIYVEDENEDPVDKAQVRLMNEDGEVFIGVTGGTGYKVFEDMPVGMYKVAVKKVGYPFWQDMNFAYHYGVWSTGDGSKVWLKEPSSDVWSTGDGSVWSTGDGSFAEQAANPVWSTGEGSLAVFKDDTEFVVILVAGYPARFQVTNVVGSTAIEDVTVEVWDSRSQVMLSQVGTSSEGETSRVLANGTYLAKYKTAGFDDVEEEFTIEDDTLEIHVQMATTK